MVKLTENEDLASLESTLKLINEVVVPGHWLGDIVRRTPGRLWCVGVARLDHDANSLEGVGDDLALRRTHDIRLAPKDQNENAQVEHAEAHEESGPEALGLLHERSGDQGERAKVDTPVEHHVDALVGDGRVDDGALTRFLDLDSHCAALVLIGNERCDVGFDATGTKTDDDDCSDVSAKCVSAGDGRREGACPENQETNPVDASEDQDGVVLSEILIGDDGSENWCDWSSKLARNPIGVLDD